VLTDSEIGKVATDSRVKAMALRITRRKLGHILGSEVQQVAEDALGDSIRALFQARDNQTSGLELEDPVPDEKILEHPVSKYLHTAVESYCNTRLTRWSHENEKGKLGSRARHVFDSDRPDSSDFFDQHMELETDLAQLDAERIDALLSSRGLDGEDIVLLKKSLSGWSYVDLADEYGGTPDKYRLKIKRAVEKADINSKLL
jgi:DNA-directed RNA polymerase specialized sigma24 family protein